MSDGVKGVSQIGIIFVASYLIFASIFLLYTIIAFWPSTNSNQNSNAILHPEISYFATSITVSEEQQMLILIVSAGALGSMIHALQSFYWYVGQRELVRSWIMMYLLLPLVGGALGTIFYLVIRAGFFSPNATIEQTNPFGFVAIASLAGLFTRQTINKLKDVFETLMTAPKEGKDSYTKETPAEDDKQEE
jgi:hypothetical protein